MDDYDIAGEPPGTATIEDSVIVLEPTPTDDPNGPLNSSKPRKILNFALASFYTLATFVLLDIATVIWVQLNLATAIWQAKMNTTWELLVINVVNGLAGAVSEALVQMTIVDLFFVHQRASANAFYNFMVNTGAYLALVAAGYSATAQGWRWIWWWTSIMLGINTVLFMFAFEETNQSLPNPRKYPTYPLKSYRQRLSLITRTDTPLLATLKRPLIILTTFPAVTFITLVWGCFLSWFSIIATMQSTYLAMPPNNYNSSQIGLFNLPPFIGGLVGAILSGPLNDWYVLFRAKQHNGVFEPETRLHLGLPSIIATPLGLLVFDRSESPSCGTDSPQFLGLTNMFIAVACIATAMMLSMILMMSYGKKLRRWMAGRYRGIARAQPGSRRI
ncbi:major facilitator superfamily domain-containing protein [Aspergillus pseudoustus]|uniref:Major facilitator superfamily domain-containing protein n=1 Tax=Aspergillus pseudoustus TaxID=1810923 RepID=A0ABR4KW48_9EURO